MREPDGGLTARLDAPLPTEVPVGAGNALFVCGSCFHGRSEIRGLSFLLDGVPQPLMAKRMPRMDVFAALPSHARSAARRNHRPRPRVGGRPAAAQLPERVLGDPRAPASRERQAGRGRTSSDPRGGRGGGVPAGAHPASGRAPGGRWPQRAALGAAGRDLHGDLQPAARSVRAPDRFDQGADASRLGLPDQRRLLGTRPAGVHGGADRRRPPIRVIPLIPASGLLRQLRAGAGDGARRRRVRRDGRPG